MKTRTRHQPSKRSATPRWLSSAGRLLVKLEYLNPELSKKDRIAREIIEDGAMSQ